MNRKTVFIVVGILVILIVLGLIRSMGRQTVQMNNEKCPVTGSRVNGSDTYVHKGKEYNLCSEKCKEPLAENPKKYLSD
jgi:YHS domain-containing protein